MTKRTTRATTKPRTTRVPLGGMNDKLAVSGKDSNYNYYIFNDKSRDIEQAKLAGYEFADQGEMLMGASAEAGSKNTRTVNSDGSKGVLMRQPIDYYKADRAEEAKQIDDIQKQIEDGPQEENKYGGASFKDE